MPGKSGAHVWEEPIPGPVCAALTWDFLPQEHLPRRDGWCPGGSVNALASSFPP